MAILKAKTTIFCATCGCAMKRSKSVQVKATDIVAAKIEAAAKIDGWKATLIGQNCRVCASIIRAVGQ